MICSAYMPQEVRAPNPSNPSHYQLYSKVSRWYGERKNILLPVFVGREVGWRGHFPTHTHRHA